MYHKSLLSLQLAQTIIFSFSTNALTLLLLLGLVHAAHFPTADVQLADAQPAVRADLFQRHHICADTAAAAAAHLFPTTDVQLADAWPSVRADVL
jgi:hypothetical protein